MLLDFVAPFKRLRAALPWRRPVCPPASPDDPCPLRHPSAPLPAWVASDPLVQDYRALLGDLPWQQFPERPADRPWPGPQPAPRAPFVAAYLVKLHEGKRSMSDLRSFLIRHPALVWWLGFERVLDPTAPHGLDIAATVPTRRQLSRVLRTLPNGALQFLLTASVDLLRATLTPEQQVIFGDTIAGDTQAILAWVAENNPKQYSKEGRLDKTRQPKGDPDCKLGVKKRHNTAPAETADALDTAPTPSTEAKAASRLQIGVDILWGYGAGLVVTRMPDNTEVVLAERTRPFNEDDITYFFPLMQQVEQRLGRRPRYGAWDTAFDAHYVYEYFHQAGGFAAVPFKGGKKGADRQFAPDGAPLCAASLALPRLFLYQDRTATVPHEREKCGCPLLHPAPTGQVCPIADPHWEQGGCTTTLAADAGARIRHTLDRDGAAYKTLYALRTLLERINSQAEALDLAVCRRETRSGSDNLCYTGTYE